MSGMFCYSMYMHKFDDKFLYVALIPLNTCSTFSETFSSQRQIVSQVRFVVLIIFMKPAGTQQLNPVRIHLMCQQ